MQANSDLEALVRKLQPLPNKKPGEDFKTPPERTRPAASPASSVASSKAKPTPSTEPSSGSSKGAHAAQTAETKPPPETEATAIVDVLHSGL